MKKAMIVNVSSIIKETGAKIDIEGQVSMSDTEFLGEYRFKTPLIVSGSISNNGKSLVLRANAEGQMITACARCMKEITIPVSFEIEEGLLKKGSVTDEELEGDEDAVVFTDDDVLMDDIVRDNFIMKVPGKYLCSEDCRGLCPVCGADLNEGECGCDKEQIDPRWASLLDIMKNNE